MNNLGFRSHTIDEGKPKRFTVPTMRMRRANGAGNILTKLKGWWKTPRSRKQWGNVILKAVGILFLLGLVTLAILWFTLPNIDDPATMFPSQSTVILDRNGTELYRLFSEEDRTYVHGDEISQNVKKSTIAIEDERFFERNSCFDVIGFTRAVLSQIAPRFFVRSGGSTLTQQFAGNALVGRQRSFIRKARELLLACQLERRYNKGELLELYLNWIPFGQNAYGIEQASRNYFALSAKDLTLAQASILSGLLQRPSYFNPYGRHRVTTVTAEAREKIDDGTITSASQIPDHQISIGLIGQSIGSGSTKVYVGGRTDQVLKNMLDQGMITLEEHNKALSDLQTLKFSPERQNIRAPHFVLWIQSQVKELLGIDDTFLQQGGLRITTTLDWSLQQAADKAVVSRRDDIKKRFGAHNIALVSVAPHTREILAYVGNADYSDEEHEGKIDMARAARQPGSSFKPFTYLSAFEQGFGPGSIIYDIPTKFGDDEPSNFDGTFWGLTTIRKALGGSRNIPAIKAFFLGDGEEPLLALASRMGITAPANQKAIFRADNPNFDYGWPLAIGAAEVPLLEMVQGYATIADGGKFHPLVSLLKITDKDGNIRHAAEDIPPVQVLDERYTAEMTSILSDVSARPNEYWQQILSVPGFAAAAKTGTSNKCLERDKEENCTLRRPESTWTMGYTPNLITGVWVGNATSQSLFDKADGLTTAAPVWHEYMVSAHKSMKNPVTTFAVPTGLTHPLLSRLSGQLASAYTPVELQSPDLALEERTPTESDPACVLLKIDKVTNTLSSPTCPAEAVEERASFLPKSELPDRWPLWEQAVQEWSTKEMEKWNAAPDHSGSLLPLPLPPTEECDPSKTPGRFDKPEVQILSPSSGEIVSYPSFLPVIRVASKSPQTQVQFYVDDKPLRLFTEPPYEGSVRMPRTIEKSGTHIFRVKVTDMYFNTVEDSVMVRFE